jgi:hypothetical protein
MTKDPIILFSQGDVINWKGLPKDLSVQQLTELLGNPSIKSDDTLGYYPAIKYSFTVDDIEGGLTAFAREDKVILIETKRLPPADVVKELPEPDLILPHEIFIDNAYAAEYIFSIRGLNLTIGKHYDKSIPDKIIRCRGFERMSSPAEFDARYYKSFKSSKRW